VSSSWPPAVVRAVAFARSSTVLSCPVTSSIESVIMSSSVSIESAICANQGGTTRRYLATASSSPMSTPELSPNFTVPTTPVSSSEKASRFPVM